MYGPVITLVKMIPSFKKKKSKMLSYLTEIKAHIKKSSVMVSKCA